MSQIPPPTVPPTTPPPPGGGGAYTPPPPPPPPPGGPAGGSDRTLMVVLSYLWILALIPLLTKKEDREVQWHAKNGLAILVAEIAVWILFTVLSMVMGDMLGCGLSMISCVVWIAFLVLRILCIVKGVNGQRFRVPFVSDFADKM
ncbi:MAG TPA: DUF4870 domain-containing protein [Thermoanaerobaculia bacterium]|nr:DUF4870 domain-containing protein [Thermoanaerobaculia bacterium]